MSVFPDPPEPGEDEGADFRAVLFGGALLALFLVIAPLLFQLTLRFLGVG